MIELKGVWRTVGGKHQLFKDLDFECKSGELVGVVGPSGCGKSTLMEILSLDRRPDAGQVLVDSQVVDFKNGEQLSLLRSDVIGYLHQSPMLFDSLDVAANIRLATGLTYESVVADDAWFRDFETLNISHLVDKMPTRLSGGERQRICLARALSKNPSLVVCDEPTAALDRESAASVVGLLEDIVRSQGAAVVVATHDPFVMRHCDRLVEMAGGAVA